ncbi:MAG: lysylphosphatidylglycerol synthase domain-containing protein [Bacteroidota bacterium]
MLTPTNNFSKSLAKLWTPGFRKWAWRTLSVAVLLAFAWQFYRLGQRMDWVAFGQALARPGQWRYLAVAAVLMPFNWWLEARKWQVLLRVFLPWSFNRILQATLAGVSISAATPNRIGEIGGRMMVAEREEWAGVVTSSILGSFCQWIAFLLLAWPGLMWTADALLESHIPFSVRWLWPIGPLLLLLGWWGGKPLLLKLMRWLESRFKVKLEEQRKGMEKVKLSLMIGAGAYACLRFSVYCIQLYLLLWFFGLELPLWRGLAGIAAIYLVQAGIPMPPGLNLVTRTELGMLLWSGSLTTSVDPATAVAVLAAFTTLFAVNVLLPALPGYFLVVRNYSSTK